MANADHLNLKISQLSIFCLGGWKVVMPLYALNVPLDLVKLFVEIICLPPIPLSCLSWQTAQQ